MQGYEKDHHRLSDRILFALELALEQQDLKLAESLNNALELSITRNAGGERFSERREYPKEIEVAMNKLRAIKGK